MRIPLRLWAGLAVIVAFVMLTSAFAGSAQGTSAPDVALAAAPGRGTAPADLTPLVSGLPLFPSNLTHFVYIVRENHVFDDYLGDCHSTINNTCNYGADYTAGGYNGGASGSHVTDTPFLHSWGQKGTVFDNMYSSIDPYSTQAHAYLISADVNGGSDSCASSVQGTGSGTEWGVYNSSNVVKGSCSFSPNSGSQTYPPDGTIFDRFTGANVKQSGGPIPFLSEEDWMWMLSGASCSVARTGGIPGSLPGNSKAVEYTSCTGSNGFWTNGSSVSAIPPTTNPATGIPEMLWDCQYTCNAQSPLLDQWSAYSYISFLSDYGLPTYSFVELFDDHPGSSCGSAFTDAQCIQWNDQSMNLVVNAIENNSAWAKSTVIAVAQDDTQNGQNGGDHINNGRRFPFVLIADPSVMKTGNPNPSSCGLTSGTCGNIVHQTFNTSNVLAVMERVEMNVNPTSFSSSIGAITTFPMQQNDQLAEGNPLEPVWRCHDPRVPCNTGTGAQTLTSTAISPSPITSQTSGTVSLTANALDASGNPITGATWAWSNPSIGSVSPSTGSSVTYTAPSSAGGGHICENATYNSVTLLGCAAITVTSTVTLSSVSITPSPTATALVNKVVYFNATATSSTGSLVWPPSATFAWNALNLVGNLNKTSGTAVAYSNGPQPGNVTVCLNVTYGSPTPNTVTSCTWLQVVKGSLPPPVLTSATLTPPTATVATGTLDTSPFIATGLDQYGNPLYTNTHYTWSLSSSTEGSVNVTSASGYSTDTWFTGGTAAGAETLTVTVTNGPATVQTKTAAISVTTGPVPLQASFVQSANSGASPLSVSFTGSVNGGTGPYTDVWNFGDGSASQTTSGANPSFTYTYSTAGGPYFPTLYVTDSASPQHTLLIRGHGINVTGTTGTPLSGQGSCTPLTGYLPLNVACQGAGTGGTSPYAIAWTWGDGSASTSGGNPPSHIYSALGQYTITLFVNDSASGHYSKQFGVDVSPQTSAGMSVAITSAPQSGAAPLSVNFAAAASGGTAPYTYSWNFGDGSAAGSGLAVSHTYQSAGSFTVTVTATDSASPGHTASAGITITVTGAPPPPPSPNVGPFGLSWTDTFLLLIVVVLVAALLIALAVKRGPRHHHEEDAAASMPGPAMTYEPAPMAGPPGPAPAPVAPLQPMGPGQDERAPDPFGGRR
ncbi:MAG: PKD domain-containing protein [Euryarchaeota archaeon]|nr:PKD domain-containing protein [Euryarchaeota archaeon]